MSLTTEVIDLRDHDALAGAVPGRAGVGGPAPHAHAQMLDLTLPQGDFVHRGVVLAAMDDRRCCPTPTPGAVVLRPARTLIADGSSRLQLGREAARTSDSGAGPDRALNARPEERYAAPRAALSRHRPNAGRRGDGCRP